jgi:hypothetical protein
MKFHYSLKKPDLTIGAIDIQEVSRPKGYKRAFRNGRGSNGFIFTVSGKMCNLLLNEDQELVSSAGELVFMPAGTVYEGRYVTTIYSENSINYYYKTETKAIVTPDEVYEGSKKVSEGTIEYVDGSFFHVDAEGNKTTATAMPNVDVLGADFKLEKQLLGKYRLPPDGKTLSTNLTADQAAQVLGVDIEANGNVTVRIETNGTYLAKVTVTYSNDVASVSIETSYTYEVLK